MNRPFNISGLLLMGLLLGSSALSQAAAPATNPHKAITGSANKAGLVNTSGKIYGKVIESINAGNYVYVHMDTGKEKHWVATTPITLENGEMISFLPNMPMYNFVSKALDRTFDVVYFVGQVYTDKNNSHSGQKGKAQPVPGIKKAKNGITIKSLLDKKEQLVGQPIHIRGKVVKYTSNVMGKNWVHIRDSSSSTDLTITTDNEVKKGDIILVSGKLILNKDFGYGYSYDVLLENSSIVVE